MNASIRRETSATLLLPRAPAAPRFKSAESVASEALTRSWTSVEVVQLAVNRTTRDDSSRTLRRRKGIAVFMGKSGRGRRQRSGNFFEQESEGWAGGLLCGGFAARPRRHQRTEQFWQHGQGHTPSEL